MEGDNFNNYGLTEKTLASDILKEFISKGYGKNNKIIKPEELKSLKFITKSEIIFKFKFKACKYKMMITLLKNSKNK